MSSVCDLKLLSKDNDKQCIYALQLPVSPDLQLSIEKLKMMANLNCIDITYEMNKEFKQFIKESVKQELKTVRTEEKQ